MKFTAYGFIGTLSVTIFLSIYNIFNYKTVINFLTSILLQKIMCKDCGRVYTMASYISLLPLFHVILNDCTRIKTFFQAFSILAAFGRIGCYFAGCCTGKETDKNSGIKYEGNYRINKKLGKHSVHVKPTIIYEIIIQFIFAFLMIYFDDGFLYFGILNAILIKLTNIWRLEPRMGDNHNIPSLSLMITFIITLIKCKDFKPDNTFNFDFQYQNLIIGLLVGLIVSNDINIKNLI